MTDRVNETVARLSSPEGRALVSELAALVPEEASAPARQTALRKRWEADEVRLALRLAEARRRTPDKFPDADRLLFTPELLEQSTAHPVAAHRAERLAPHGRVLDLGCGGGGDLTRLALSGAPVAGLERDPLSAALARTNLAAVGAEGEVTFGEFPGVDLPSHDILFADPARRTGPRGPGGSRRLTDPSDLSPRPSDLRPLLDSARAWAVKWGPGLDLSAEAMTAPGALLEGLAPDRWSLEVVSWNGGVREAVFLGGEAALAGPAATILTGPVDAAATWAYHGDPTVPPPGLTLPADWLLETDGALLRAGLMNAYARDRGLGLLAEGIAYLTADAAPQDPGVRSWRRLASVPWSRRRVQDLCDEHGVGTLVIKTRGFPQPPEEVRRSLDLRGDRTLVLFLHRGHDGHHAHLCLPPDPEEKPA